MLLSTILINNNLAFEFSNSINVLLILYKQKVTNYNNPPQTKQYYPLLALSNQTSQEVTHPATTLTEARLTAEF
jgi:hypothetical protein